MAHLDTAYKLGSLAAVNDFTAWLQSDEGNPTEYPKRHGSVFKTAQTPAAFPATAPSPAPSATTSAAGGGSRLASGLGNNSGMSVGGGGVGGNSGGGSVGGSGGGAIKASAHQIKMAIVGGRGQNCKDMPEVCNPGGPPPKPPPPPPPKKQTAQLGSGGMVATAADHAVEQVMRKLGKSMSRRPLGREGTKFEALKKKLRKQKSKKR